MIDCSFIPIKKSKYAVEEETRVQAIVAIVEVVVVLIVTVVLLLVVVAIVPQEGVARVAEANVKQ